MTQTRPSARSLGCSRYIVLFEGCAGTPCAAPRDGVPLTRCRVAVRQDKSELSSRVTTLQQDLTASKTALERAWNDNERLSGMLNEAQAQADALSRQAKALQDQRATLSSTADTAGDRERQAQHLVATLRVEKESVQHELDMVLVEVRRSHTAVEAAETAKQEAQQEVERLSSRVTALQEESTALQQQVADKVTVCRELQEKLVELRVRGVVLCCVVSSPSLLGVGLRCAALCTLLCCARFPTGCYSLLCAPFSAGCCSLLVCCVSFSARLYNVCVCVK